MADLPLSLRPHLVTIKRGGRVPDGQGGYISTPVAVATFQGRIAPASQKDVVIAQQMQANVTHAVYAPAGTDLRPADVLEHDGRTFHVKVSSITPSVPAYRKALAEERQTAQ